MVESLNANFMAALRKGSLTIVWKVEIVVARGTTVNTDGTVTYVSELDATFAWVSGGSSLFGFDPCVDTVGAISSTLDPLTRKMTASQVEVVFADDGPLRSVGAAEYLRGQTLRLYLGTPELVESDFVQRFEGAIVEVLPEEEGRIRVIANDWRASGAVKDAVQYGFNGVHPYDVLLSLVESGGAHNLNSTSFAAPASRSHWMTAISSTDAQEWAPSAGAKVDTDEPLEFGLDELVFLLGGCIRSRYPTAATEWLDYDPSAVPVRTLGPDDVYRVAQKEVGEKHYNQLSTSMNGKIKSKAKPPYKLVEGRYQLYEDRELIFRHYDAAAVGRSNGEFKTYSFESRLFHNNAQVVGFKNSGVREWWNDFVEVEGGELLPPPDPQMTPTTEAITLFAPTRCGITGAKASSDGRTLAAPLDSTHLAYLMLVGSGKIEFVSANANAVVYPPAAEDIDPTQVVPTADVVFGMDLSVFQFVDYTLHERGLFGSTAESFYSRAFKWLPSSTTLWAFDITALVACCQRNVDRFRDGITLLDVLVHPEHIDLEYGDAVALSDALPLAYGLDGVTANDVFEVIMKEELLDTDQPSIRLTLAWMHSFTPLSKVSQYRVPQSSFRSNIMPWDQLLDKDKSAFQRYFGGAGLLE